MPRSGYAGGAPAYGYRAEGRALVPDQAESAILARMRQWEGKGLSRRAIAERLNAEGTPTKRGSSWQYQRTSCFPLLSFDCARLPAYSDW